MDRYDLICEMQEHTSNWWSKKLEEVLEEVQTKLAAAEVDAAKWRRHIEQKEYVFSVNIEDGPKAEHRSADDAVKYAMQHVHMDAVNYQSAVDTLNQGQVYSYSYEFSAAHIIPVPNRKLTTSTETASVKEIPVLTRLDKEVLYFAARAIGYSPTRIFPSHDGGLKLFEDGESGSGTHWNPLVDNGDAMKLAVKLEMTFLAPDKYDHTAVAQHIDAGNEDLDYTPIHVSQLVSENNNDPYAASRLAIVLVAAEIGKRICNDTATQSLET